MLAIDKSTWRLEEPPEISISPASKVECGSVICGWYEYADDESYALELRRQHREWHEDGCPPLL